ncbi:MAG: ribonuclease D, partial [Candidatus Omnitrophica bacterium]|nr:ribonuclease D [Candidatus Omnitrophota bacterium]
MVPENLYPSYQLVETEKQLLEIVPDLQSCSVIACDVEVDTLFHYSESFCLLQVSAWEKVWLVDPLAIRNLSPLAPIFANQAVEKIFHGADFDRRILKKYAGISCQNVFDTELAARYLSLPSRLSYLLKNYFGVTVEKKFQKYDWNRRPLPPEMRAYAASDVYWLTRLAKRLKEQLRQLKRLDWVEEECQWLAEKP